MKKYKIINCKNYNIPINIKTIDGGSLVSVMLIKSGIMEILESQLSSDLKIKEENKLLKVIEVVEFKPQPPPVDIPKEIKSTELPFSRKTKQNKLK
jgi:hypothetical protein